MKGFENYVLQYILRKFKKKRKEKKHEWIITLIIGV